MTKFSRRQFLLVALSHSYLLMIVPLELPVAMETSTYFAVRFGIQDMIGQKT